MELLPWRITYGFVMSLLSRCSWKCFGFSRGKKIFDHIRGWWCFL